MIVQVLKLLSLDKPKPVSSIDESKNSCGSNGSSSNGSGSSSSGFCSPEREESSTTLRSEVGRKLQEDVCPICLEGTPTGGCPVDVISTCCLQGYHTNCRHEQLLKKKSSCATCRRKVPLPDLRIALAMPPDETDE